MSNERAIRAIVRGVVQGVGFRYSTRQAAQRLGVVGWARNAADGSVEVLAQGPPHAVDELIEFLAEGPRYARVLSVEVADENTNTGRTSFEILL